MTPPPTDATQFPFFSVPSRSQVSAVCLLGEYWANKCTAWSSSSRVLQRVLPTAKSPHNGRRRNRRATQAVHARNEETTLKRMPGPYSLGPRHSRRVGPQGARGAFCPKLWSQMETTTQRRENTHPSHLGQGKGPPSLRDTQSQSTD